MKPFEKTPVWYFKNTFSSPCTWSKDEVTCSAPRHHGHLQRAFWLHYFQFKDDLVQFKTQTSQAPAVPLRLDYNMNSIPAFLHGGASWVTSCGFVIWALPRFFCDRLCREESERSVKKQWEGMQQSTIRAEERAFVPLFMAFSG